MSTATGKSNSTRSNDKNDKGSSSSAPAVPPQIKEIDGYICMQKSIFQNENIKSGAGIGFPLSASSYFDVNHEPFRGSILFTGSVRTNVIAWCPGNGD